MSAAFRAPTANRLQRLLTTRTLPSPSSPSPPSRHLILPRQTNHSFSTSLAARNSNTTNSSSNNGTVNANGNPAYPRFDLRTIVPNPRARKAVIAAFCVVAAAEAYMWVTYWPRIAGWWGEGEGEGRGKGEGSE